MAPASSFATLFRRVVSDLTPADAAGWASGTCPYCRTPGAFRVNLATGKWVCLPRPSPESGTPTPRRATGTGRASPRGDRRGDSEAPAPASPPGGRGGGTEWARLSYRRKDRIAAGAATPDS